MTITIRPEHEHLIVQAIENGSYKSPDDLIARAFWQFERGEFFSPAQSRSEMEKRKAEWLREHHA